jgi:DNA-binding transcriptional LysR family regulator
MSNFDRRQLRYFVAVAEELHFGNAARRLHISQPPLSQQIAALEVDLGVRLFERTKRKVDITAAGQQFLHDARLLLSDMDKAAVRARRAAAGQTGLLRVGLNYSAPISPNLSAIFRRFVKRYPHVGLELHENTSAKQLDGLYRRALDICFIWPTRDDAAPDITLYPLGKDPLCLVTAQENPLARIRNLKASDLRGQILFLTQRQTRMDFYDSLMANCRRAGFAPDIRTDIIQLPFIMNIVAARQGIAFIPKFFDRIRPQGTVFRPCGFLPQLARVMPLSLACRSHDSSPLVQNFLTAVKEA